MIEREMEGGVIVEQPLPVVEDYIGEQLGGLIEVEGHVEVRKRGS
jgi:hypothetical protein